MGDRVNIIVEHLRRTAGDTDWSGTADSRGPPCSVPAAWSPADRWWTTGCGAATRTTTAATWPGWAAWTRRCRATTRCRGGTATGPGTRPGCWRTSGSRGSWTTRGTGSPTAWTAPRGARPATAARCSGRLLFAGTPERLRNEWQC